MRVAIVSDIHGNLTALEAVIADLGEMAPDLVLHGGDLAVSGSRPADAVDCIRDLGWPGVLGNTDEMHTRPGSLDDFARQSTAPLSLWTAVRELAGATRELLGEGRIEWMRGLPGTLIRDQVALVHAKPGDLWRSPGAEAADQELAATYEPLGCPIVVYGHIHRSFIRIVRQPGGPEMLVINTGSVSLSYDGDPRAAYVLLDDGLPTIRRVEYDVEREIQEFQSSGLPHSDWVAAILRAGAPRMPPSAQSAR